MPFIASSVAVAMNIYNDFGGRQRGENLLAGGFQTYLYNSTSPVDLHSQHPIDVMLIYNGKTLLENLQDEITNETYTKSYTVDIAALVGGDTAYVGFTGVLGGDYSTQTINSFAFGPVPEPSALVLLGIGAISLLGYAWRRRKRAA